MVYLFGRRGGGAMWRSFVWGFDRDLGIGLRYGCAGGFGKSGRMALAAACAPLCSMHLDGGCIPWSRQYPRRCEGIFGIGSPPELQLVRELYKNLYNDGGRSRSRSLARFNAQDNKEDIYYVGKVESRMTATLPHQSK